MKATITGLKKEYTSGDNITCSLTVEGNERIISSDINLVQVDTQRVSNGQVCDVNGMWHPAYKMSDGEYTILSGLLNNVIVTGKFRGELRFKIPDDATNTSERIGRQFSDYKSTGFGIRVLIKFVDKKGREDELNYVNYFQNKRFVPESGPAYHQDNMNIENPKFSMLYRTSTSTFLPGETVHIDLVYIPKTKKKVHSLSVKFVSHGRYNMKVKSKKYGYSVKSLVNKNMSNEEEYEYMKSMIDRGLGNRFTLKVPDNLHEDTRSGMVLLTNIKMFRISPSKLDFFDFEEFCNSVKRMFFCGYGGKKYVSSFQ